MKIKLAKKVLCYLLSAVYIILIFSVASGCNSGEPSIVLSADKKQMAEITSLDNAAALYEKEAYSSYIDFVIDEAVEILIAGGISEKAAGKSLISKGYTIETVFDSIIFNTIEQAYTNNKELEGVNIGSAITDLNGKLLAVYGTVDATEGISYANKKLAPYSSFKPLSVYTPLIERGDACWSSLYKDSPIKKVTDEQGNQTDWPANSTNTYLNTDIALSEAVKKSINTVAVRCLQQLTVEKSLNFLENSFDLDLESEKALIKQYGDEEVYGNLAMGYLREGVSAVQIAGYYQIFANGGRYTKPYAIAKITDKNGNTVYEAKAKGKRVIKPTTADVMNKLLQGVVTPLGTGAEAKIDGINIGGKTGTGTTEDLRGNWFVGFTPEITCSVWHGESEGGNIADEIFASIVSKLNLTKTKYPSSGEITMRYYCPKSGLLFGENCTLREKGYFIAGNIPQICEKCGS